MRAHLGHIVDATKWPQWYPNSKDVRIDGGDVLKEGTVFHWSTFGLPLESKVNEFVPYTRIGWYGYAPGTAPSFSRPKNYRAAFAVLNRSPWLLKSADT
jgi:hypothetical protein